MPSADPRPTQPRGWSTDHPPKGWPAGGAPIAIPGPRDRHPTSIDTGTLRRVLRVVRCWAIRSKLAPAQQLPTTPRTTEAIHAGE